MVPPDPQHHPFHHGSGLVLALTTEANEVLAEALATAVLEAGLAACVALTPCRSLYRWQGVLERSHEVQLLIKCHPTRLDALWRLVRERHSYTTPEWITWPAHPSEDYGAWLAGCCGVAEQAAAPAETA
ncbi:CutA1 divalent ion tolerance protein [Cyanobium sp. PCC 7001]|uniref:divalent-cation tolerance protein CutA n=1 Tax=Cyanobium sp. PCC 7001 TaxID=180281 RepID=UPI0001805048|nr:divalent-cation tolerance protein CutA [Cyanobium sp. PCC 7001]EDY38314.1 CutA1 divalent ion tolerance protein [Cyanobium sp. PCC 7001]